MTPPEQPDRDPPDLRRARIPPYLAGPPVAGRPEPVPGADPAAVDVPAAPDPADTSRPRPFVLTSGRASADPDINLETQVSAVRTLPPWADPVSTLPPEQRTIIHLCLEPLSVAEISARVPLHLGVTKILVSDLRAGGYLDVHLMDAPDPHDPDLILRVIRGLRAIT